MTLHLNFGGTTTTPSPALTDAEYDRLDAIDAIRRREIRVLRASHEEYSNTEIRALLAKRMAAAIALDLPEAQND